MAADLGVVAVTHPDRFLARYTGDALRRAGKGFCVRIFRGSTTSASPPSCGAEEEEHSPCPGSSPIALCQARMAMSASSSELEARRSCNRTAPCRTVHEALGTVRQGAVRFSFSVFNSEDEADMAIQAVKELAQSK